MSLLRSFVILFMVFCGVRALAVTSVTDVRLDSGNLLLLIDDGAQNISLSRTVPFEFVARALGGERAELVRDEVVVLKKSTFKKLIRLFPESNSPSHWNERFKDIQNQGDNVLITLALGLKSFSVPKGPDENIKKWLQCGDDSYHLCLGIKEQHSNPNLLTRDLELLKGAQIKKIFSRSELRELFAQAGFPEALAQWMTLTLDVRQQLMSGQRAEAALAELHGFSAAPEIVNGEVRGSYVDFKVDFTLDFLEDKIKQFISSRAKDIEELAKYTLAHFPYQSFESEKMRIGNIGASLGMMVRIKRKVLANTSPGSSDNNFIVKDSIEIFVSMGVAPKSESEKGLFLNGGFAAGPAYYRRYEASRFAVSREEGQKGYWQIPIKLMLHNDLSGLKPDEKVSFESGWVANLNGSVSGGRNLKLLSIKPQVNAAINYRWLSRRFASRNKDGSLFIGVARGQQFDRNLQAMLRSFWKLARLPVVSYEGASRSEQGKSFLIPENRSLPQDLTDLALQYLFDKGDSTLLEKYYPSANLELQAKTSYLFLNWFLGNSDNTANQMDIKLIEDVTKKSWTQGERQFYVYENSHNNKNLVSLLHAPSQTSCSAWMGVEAFKEKDPQVLYRLKCFYEFSRKDPMLDFDLKNLADSLAFTGAELQKLRFVPAALSRTVTLEVELKEDILLPIYRGKTEGWILDFKNEVLRVREEARRNPEKFMDHEEVQERFLIYANLGLILSNKNPAERLRLFFQYLTTSGAHETFLKGILKRNPNAFKSIEIFTPKAEAASDVETITQRGVQASGESFEFLIHRDKWLGK